jgi:hypothetical protein
VATATYPNTHAGDLNSNPRLAVMLRAFLVVLASRFMMTFLLNDHGGPVMMAVLMVFPPRFIVTVLNP